MNNREIKFRIWDKQNKNWLENSSSLHCYSNWTICPFTGKLVDYIGAYDGDHGDTFTSSPADDHILQGKFLLKPRYVIQQYTGMKDRHGNDIYEGDILKYGDLYYEVMWADYQWIATCPYYNHYHWPKFESFGREARSSIVSGSVFENPELIKTNE